MRKKGFKTICEQLGILRIRGLKIEDEDIAKGFLLYNNYYRVSGYSLTLRDHNVFFPTATFQNIIDIYSFDMELRHVLLKYIEVIEVAFKSVYVYEFTKCYGGLGYLNNAYFTNKKKYNEIMAKINVQKEKRLSHEAYLKHYVDDLKQPIPMWAYIDLFTISDISLLYSITELSIKKKIANTFSLTTNDASDILGKFMHGMTIIRNLCAHGSRLYNRLFVTKPSLNAREKKLLNKTKDGSLDNSHLLGYILNMRRLLRISEFNQLKSDLISISDKYPFVDMKHYGFCSDWRKLL